MRRQIFELYVLFLPKHHAIPRDGVMSDSATCFICLSDDPVLTPTPCGCRGSVGQCHADCLRRARETNQRPDCPVCHTPYTDVEPEAEAAGRDIRSRGRVLMFTACFSTIYAVPCFFVALHVSRTPSGVAATAALLAFCATLLNVCIVHLLL